jgi:hypothetical protein
MLINTSNMSHSNSTSEPKELTPNHLHIYKPNIRVMKLAHSVTFFRFYFLSTCNLCIFIVMSMYSYCMLMYLLRASWHSSVTLTEVFPCFFLSCKANARVKPAKTGHGLHSSKIFVLFYVLFVLCRSVYCLCVNVYCTTATGWLPKCS